MTSYSKRDLRAADFLAMILAGFGAILLLVAALPLLPGNSVKGGGPSPEAWLVASVCLALGIALNRKVRELVRNAGREPEDYPGVPE